MPIEITTLSENTAAWVGLLANSIVAAHASILEPPPNILGTFLGQSSFCHREHPIFYHSQRSEESQRVLIMQIYLDSRNDDTEHPPPCLLQEEMLHINVER
jgi:hypothetical protein